MKKLSNTETELKKALLIKKACTSSSAKITIFFVEINTSADVLPQLSNNFSQKGLIV